MSGVDRSQKESFWDSNLRPFFSAPHLATSCLVIANCAVFGAWRITRQLARSRPVLANKVQDFMLRNFSCTTTNRPHTLFTYGVSHLSAPHFLLNMWTLGMIGPLLSDKLLPLQVVGIYFGGTFLGGVLEVWRSAKTPILGASAGIMALLSALSVLEPSRWWTLLFPVPGMSMSTMQIADALLLVHIPLGAKVIWRWLKYPGIPHSRIAYLSHIGRNVGGIFIRGPAEEPRCFRSHPNTNWKDPAGDWSLYEMRNVTNFMFKERRRKL